jgi:hypothetical protein
VDCDAGRLIVIGFIKAYNENSVGGEAIGLMEVILKRGLMLRLRRE